MKNVILPSPLTLEFIFWRCLEQLDLYLTINFNEQWKPLLGGRVKFGLKGGELRLKLENGEIPLAVRDLNGSFDLSIQEERQQQESVDNQSGLETSVAENKSGIQNKLPTEITIQKTERSQFTSCQVSTNDSETNPAGCN